MCLHGSVVVYRFINDRIGVHIGLARFSLYAIAGPSVCLSVCHTSGSVKKRLKFYQEILAGSP